MRARLSGVAYAAGWSRICRLPESWGAAAVRFVADIAWRRQGPGSRVLEGNLRRVLGREVTGKELRAASRASMRSYARYWLEIFRLRVMPIERLMTGMSAHGCVDEVLAHLASPEHVRQATEHHQQLSLSNL